MPGKPGLVRDSENSHAPTTAKAGFTNSDGWIDRPGTWIQRRAPLISTPTTSVA